MRYFVNKIKEVEEKTLSWDPQGIGKGFRGYVEDKTERNNYKISTKFNEVILIFPSTELQKSIDFGSQTLNISCTIEFIMPYLVGVSNNGRGTKKIPRACARTF